ncbi:hypothetical protein ABEG63_14030 [Chryseobacterium sp. C39-AII1]|uniref:hypothetical protein n=1 Tax=Chryseobacterium sp. C39-AII1 TaxID=3080332 RepID=UPI00320A2289
MENLNATMSQVINNEITYEDGRIGNKLENLFNAIPLINIHKIIAESFFDNARIGVFPFMASQNINFNNGGLYEVSYSYLNEICEIMEAIKATFLTFTFVEIDSNDQRLRVSPYSQKEMIYMVASLQNKNERTIDENNYLLVNANPNFPLETLKISDEELEVFRSKFQSNGHIVLNKYFKKENTRTISYHIKDLRTTLAKDTCEKYIIHLCQISNVMKIISDHNLRDILNEDQYREHFQGREKQITLVFTTDTEYYDMGGLRP